jgi:hypothetical protein
MFMAPMGFAEEIYPSGCTPLVVQEEQVMLSSKKPVLILFHNVSKLDLWLTHPVAEANAKAGWSSRLQTEHWSALALDAMQFQVSCIESKPGHEQQVPCPAVLTVCQWDMNKKHAASGTFWAAEDSTLSTLTAHLGRNGFLVPSASQSVVD